MRAMIGIGLVALVIIGVVIAIIFVTNSGDDE